MLLWAIITSAKGQNIKHNFSGSTDTVGGEEVVYVVVGMIREDIPFFNWEQKDSYGEAP